MIDMKGFDEFLDVLRSDDFLDALDKRNAETLQIFEEELPDETSQNVESLRFALNRDFTMLTLRHYHEWLAGQLDD